MPAAAKSARSTIEQTDSSKVNTNFKRFIEMNINNQIKSQKTNQETTVSK
jgi:hypothetical protein